MSTKFKVGDRIACYHAGHRYTGHVDDVANVHLYVELEQLSPALNPLEVHEKQCRKLTPKQPKRRLYALIPSYGVASVAAWFDRNAALEARSFNEKEMVEFVEVRKKL